MSKTALGRGLGALLGSSPVTAKPAVSASPSEAPPAVPLAEAGNERVQHVAWSQVQPCDLQPRKDFPPESLQELADSIREKGVVQPLIVRRGAQGLELIAGERRWRAARMAGLDTVPVLVREAEDRAVLELALIENLQRENLNPIEEAQGYSQLVGQFELTQEEVARRVGKSRAAIANALRLLRLDPSLQALLREGRLSVGHAKVILGVEDAHLQKTVGQRVVKEALNVRQTEGLVARLQQSNRESRKRTAAEANTHVASLEGHIRDRLGTKVRLRYKTGKGSLEISFFSDEELERILQLLGVNAG